LRLRLLVVSEAERQIRDAAEWWRANRPAARGLFRRELARGFDLITTQPNIGMRALDVPIAGVRRLDLFRIHYYLYYRVRGSDAVEVLALWHTRRGELPPLGS
jgi:plasmid stabilization system protein ParE